MKIGTHKHSCGFKRFKMVRGDIRTINGNKIITTIDDEEREGLYNKSEHNMNQDRSNDRKGDERTEGCV